MYHGILTAAEMLTEVFFFSFRFDFGFYSLEIIFLWKINYSNKFSYLNHSKKVLIEINPSVLMYTSIVVGGGLNRFKGIFSHTFFAG